MTDRERLQYILKTYDQLESLQAIVGCYLEVFHKDMSAAQIYNLVTDINDYLGNKVRKFSQVQFVARERAAYLRCYLSGDMWLTEEAAKANIQPQIDNAQAIIDVCDNA